MRILCCSVSRQELGGDEHRFEHVLTILDQFEQTVESSEPGLAYVDVTAIAPWFSGCDVVDLVAGQIFETTGLRPRWGLAGTRFAARLLAERLPAGHAIALQPGTERQVLAGLPLDGVALSLELRHRLDLLGIRTLGDFARLPATAILAQFGREGQNLYRQIQAQTDRPLTPYRRERVLSRIEEFDPPLGDLILLQRHLDRLLCHLIQELEAQALACQRITLGLKEETGWRGGTLRAHTPLASFKGLQLACQELLNTTPVSREVHSLKLELGQLQARAQQQLALFPAYGADPRRWERMLAHLMTKYGSERFQRARSYRSASLQATLRFQMGPLHVP